MNNVEKCYLESNTPSGFTKNYFRYLNEIYELIDVESVTEVVNQIIAVSKNKGCIFVLGNGGSAATASHLVNDLCVGVNQYGLNLNVRGLTDNISVITAIANDFSYDDVFVKQIEHCLCPNDIVLAYSVSGASQNVISAVEYANSKGVATASFTGFSGGKLKEISKFNVHVPSLQGEYGPVEDAHLACNHIISNYLMEYSKHEK